MSKSSQSEPTSNTEPMEEKELQKPSINSEDGELTKEEGLRWILSKDLRLVPDVLVMQADMDLPKFRRAAELLLSNPCVSSLYGLDKHGTIIDVILVRYDLIDRMVHLTWMPPIEAVPSWPSETKGILDQITATYGKCTVVFDTYTRLEQEG